VPLTYFNIVKLKAGEHFDYRVPGYETCVVPATGTVTVETGAKPSPRSATAARCLGRGAGGCLRAHRHRLPDHRADRYRGVIAGAKYAETLKPFAVRAR
jgi:5-deoxy-glucuronate isomerase